MVVHIGAHVGFKTSEAAATRQPAWSHRLQAAPFWQQSNCATVADQMFKIRLHADLTYTIQCGSGLCLGRPSITNWLEFVGSDGFRCDGEMRMMKMKWAIVGLLLAPGIAVADLTVRDSVGSQVGRIESSGEVRSAVGSSEGRIGSDGTVRNGVGSSIGRVDKDGMLRNSVGSSIGRVDKDGTLRDAAGSSIARISGCEVRNANGQSRARFEGCSPADHPKIAAYLFFFKPLHNR